MTRFLLVLSSYSEIPAALPYIGAYLDQIYSLEMCTKTYNKDNLVNFTKMTKVHLQKNITDLQCILTRLDVHIDDAMSHELY